MTKFNLLVCSIFILSIVILPGCHKTPKDHPCVSYSQAPVTNITGANTASVNQTIPLTIDLTCFNGCGQFGYFEKSTVGNTITIKAIAKYEGCVCTADIPTRQAIYNFTATQSGTYSLNFLQSENNYLTHTITVQ